MIQSVRAAGALVARSPGIRSGVNVGAREVAPVFSLNRRQARRQVLLLYRAWYREIPYFLMEYHVPVSAEQCRKRLKEIFMANRNVTDIRVIDMLVAKGQMELRETMEVWKQAIHLMSFFRDTEPPKSHSFLSKFLHGKT
ncbi:NADH dehydrogenase [ubiquinone] 1 alpha subcomplex subunit 6-like [Paramacrobiotus metropolitanus]|uniref:NADH dehydrogenase [ubiquinone] 1 alpha subcomplex subunit 6-like n=1 Tax=Paramacrobiotus metropolitanus TaxID=2943436 RepID=UPI002445F3CD|nr:NADH dehydrogenase [ubiquinone] 1 alpha subcomplex subunit 6-like [Paramacrobiotus metropolitanus]